MVIICEGGFVLPGFESMQVFPGGQVEQPLAASEILETTLDNSRHSLIFTNII